MASTLLHNPPLDMGIGSRRSCFVMEKDQASLQKWLFAQQPPKQSKRPSPQSLVPLRAIPYTAAEWKRVLAEVKRDYSNNRYRSCSSRCVEILDNVNGRDFIQPAYIIYLHFYVASSLEMQVRGLHVASSRRLALLEEAREHYSLASQMAKDADKQALHLSFRAHSPSSSLHSPVDSCLSQSTLSTRMSSPTPSSHSVNSNMTKPKKKVAFRDELEYEPIRRPDSPTLGFDDPASGRNSPCHDISDDPLPPSVQSMPDTLPFTPSPSLNGDDGFENNAPLACESTGLVERYCTVLSSIQKQINSHLVSIDRDITAALTPRAALSTNAEMKQLDLRTRIDRLRANGWQRKRFDAKRYDEFREQVVADMLS